jgi:1-acyl-sn-glycerol-3-phosphate acyltransferase
MPLRIILELSQIIWIDWSVAGGVSALFARAMDELTKRLLVAFPEGTMTNEDSILKFHRGSFLTKHPIQPLALRYWQSFVPKGWNINAYIEPNFLKYLFGLLAMPWSIVTLDVLPVIIPGEDETPDQLAVRTQLAIANHLKVKAIDRSSDELFRKKKAARQARAEAQKPPGEVEKPKEE